MMRSLLLLLPTLLLVGQVRSQWFGRMELYRSQQVFEDHPIESFMGYGFDHVVSERSSIGLDLLGSWSSLFSGGSGYRETSYLYVSDISYRPARAIVSLSLRSDFAFSDITDKHVYLGSTAGLTWARASVNILSMYDSNYNNISPGQLGLKAKTAESTILIPLGFRLGFRGGMDGGFADLYVGAGVNIGPDGLAANPLIPRGVALSSTFLQFGLAFAFGG